MTNELRYKVIGQFLEFHQSRAIFEEMVSDALEQGYVLHGNLIVQLYPDGVSYLQAVYLPREEAQP